MDLAQPASLSLGQVIAKYFDAKLIDSTIHYNNPHTIASTGNYSISSTWNNSFSELSMKIIEGSDMKLYKALRSGLFQEMIGYNAVMMSCSCEFGKSLNTTDVCIAFCNLEEMVRNIEQYSWTKYEKQFQALIEETLTS